MSQLHQLKEETALLAKRVFLARSLFRLSSSYLFSPLSPCSPFPFLPLLSLENKELERQISDSQKASRKALASSQIQREQWQGKWQQVQHDHDNGISLYSLALTHLDTVCFFLHLSHSLPQIIVMQNLKD